MSDYTDTYSILNDQIAISNYLYHSNREETVPEIIKALSSERKFLPSRLFYDHQGSMLFEEITRLPEYYLTRTEKHILKEIAPILSENIKYDDVVELGSGDCSKISILFNAISSENLHTVRYIPVDVSHAAILKSAEKLTLMFPGISIQGILADFQKHLNVIPCKNNRLICFFGSTIGNLSQEQAILFLKELKSKMNQGDHLLIGMDMVKDISTMEKAYNDSQGITAQFNKNIINVVDQLMGIGINTELFGHIAFFNRQAKRIEMHLKVLEDIELSFPNYQFKILLRKGETIHTENSHKYTKTQIQHFSNITGLKINHIYTDHNQWFSIVHFTA